MKGVEGKQLSNLDFIVKKNGVVYGVDLKNWIKYERRTGLLAISKVALAVQLGVVPFIVSARRKPRPASLCIHLRLA